MKGLQFIFWTVALFTGVAIVGDAIALFVFGNIVMFTRLARGVYP